LSGSFGENSLSDSVKQRRLATQNRLWELTYQDLLRALAVIAANAAIHSNAFLMTESARLDIQ
jgi:hypothetical protein